MAQIGVQLRKQVCERIEVTMQTAQPAASPLGILLLVAAIYLVVKSPRKLQTLG